MREIDLRLLRMLEAIAPSDEELERAFGQAEREEADDAGEVLEAVGFSDAELAAKVSDEAKALIIRYEVASRKRYEARYRKPVWPGGASGVTIGIGYDLGHQSVAGIAGDWQASLPSAAIVSLQRGAGVRGAEAQSLLSRDPGLAATDVPWGPAITVFKSVNIPEYARRTLRAFPGSENLNGHCFGALVSLVYNRGANMNPNKDSRREMREIADHISCGELREIPQRFREMKRLWVGKNLDGLLKRREAEAVLFQYGYDLSMGLEAVGDAPTVTAEEELAYQVGLYSEAVRGEGEHYESVGADALAWTTDQIVGFGREWIRELSASLRSKICDNPGEGFVEDLLSQADVARDGTGSEAVVAESDASEYLESADARAGGAMAGASHKKPLREMLTTLLPATGMVLPRILRRKIIDLLFETVIPTAAEELGHVAIGRLCAVWPPEILPGDASTPAATKALGPAPAAAASDDPKQTEPEAQDPKVLMAALRDAWRSDPSAFDKRTWAELGAMLDVSMGVASSDPFPLIKELVDAAAESPVDPAKIDKAADALIEALGDPRIPLSRDAVCDVLDALRRVRRFDALSRVADRFLSRDPEMLGVVARRYGQGLIDSGRLNAAIALMRRAAQLSPEELDAKERRELVGLLGRAHKDLYVKFVRSPRDAAVVGEETRNALRESIKWYRLAHGDHDPAAQHWPFINRIALLALARRDYVEVDDPDDPKALAETLVAALDGGAEGSADQWTLGSLGEGYLALDRFEDAARCFGSYAQNADAFALAGTIRQLEEVWRLQASADGAGAILTGLKATLAQREGGVVTLSPDERRRLTKAESSGSNIQYKEHFETRTEDGRIVEFSTLQQIVKCGSAVCAVQKAAGPNGRTMGTGFLVNGSDFSDHLDPAKSYVLTNAHVLWDEDDPRENSSALFPGNARIVFEGAKIDGQDDVYLCARVVWQSPSHECDAALIELDRKIDKHHIEPLGIARLGGSELRIRSSNNRGSRLAVIGHPHGGGLSVSVAGALGEMQATLVDIGPRSMSGAPTFLHYETPTEQGNSGSPVFEADSWQVVGLHHAGFDVKFGRPKLRGAVGMNRANEGIWIGSIKEAVAAHLEAQQPKAAARPTRRGSLLGGLLGKRTLPAGKA